VAAAALLGSRVERGRPGVLDRRAAQHGGEGGVEVPAGHEGEPAEDPPRWCRELVIGQPERGRDLQIAGAELVQAAHLPRRGSTRLRAYPIVGMNVGGRRAWVRCSYAYASGSSSCSPNRGPMNDTPIGNGPSKPAGTVTLG
jgi:hypothetical protein